MMWPFKREKRSMPNQGPITQIPGFWPDYSGGPMAMGHVSVSRALALVPVFAAIRTIADLVSSLTPVLYYRSAPGAIPQRQPTPSLFANPSIHGTTCDWLFRGTASMASSGDAIGLITDRDYYGYPKMIEWLSPEQVATQDGKLYGPGSFMNPLWWWYGRPIDPRDLVHIPWFTMPYRVRGLSPIGAFQLTCNMGLGAQEYAANWFTSRGVPPGTFKNSERTFDEVDADLLTNRLVSRIQSGKPLVYGRDWSYEPIAIKPHEAQFVETMQLTATQVATIYGIPVEDLGGSTGNPLTYSTVEMNNIKLLTRTLRPWLVRWEQSLTRCFPRGYYVKFDTNEMLRLDAKTQAEIDALSLGFNPPGWMDVNEIRANRDLPPMKTPAPQPKQPVTPQPPVDDGGESGSFTRDRVNGKASDHATISNANQHLSSLKTSGTKGN